MQDRPYSPLTMESGESSQRRERAAIAAQACQTCRNRKSKCDEQRPKCGLCQRLNVDCEYREPLPTKKDKTMVHILDTLARLENKFDSLGLSPQSNAEESTPGATESSMSRASMSRASTASGPSSKLRQDANKTGSETVLRSKQNSQHLTVPHKILLWPCIYIGLMASGAPAAADTQNVLQEGTPWFIKQELNRHPDPLRSDLALSCFAVNASSPAARERPSSSHVAFPSLTIQAIQEFTDAYFNTFNVLFPLLNRESFMNETVSRVLRTGYSDGDVNSVLALMVFALGQVAVEGVFDRPISTVDRMASGFRGGTADEPPGLAIFNEARRRMGFVATQTTLENVQIMLLQALYYQSCARHLDFWRSTVAASMACQVMIRCKTFEWQSPGGDLIKRAYWVCVLNEDFYHLDLDLPQSGIQSMEDEVPLPYFHVDSQPGDQGGSLSEERSHFQYHFLAMIALRRLIARIHAVIHESAAGQAESTDDYGGPPVPVIREMGRQLDSWRALLPRPLQWSDEDKFNFPTMDSNSRQAHEPLFSVDQGAIPIGHKYNLDVVTAHLRTRFYYARFMMYRPFVYKALHFSELMTSEDADCCALAIKSACLWPLAMAPPKHKKRLVPHLFAWTQNFLGIVLILWMTVKNDCLKRICDEQLDRGEIEATAGLMLEWVKDVKQMDGIAAWSWKLLESIAPAIFS